MGRSFLLWSYEADVSFDSERHGHLTLLRAVGCARGTESFSLFPCGPMALMRVACLEEDM